MLKLQTSRSLSMLQRVSVSVPAQLQLLSEPLVMIISGWGGAGKTQTIGRALEGFGSRTKEVGVIINERNKGSVEIDLARLPQGFEKLGIHGCACCSQLSDVMNGIKTFAAHGRSLTFIEQSPLSVTGDLRHGLRQRGHTNVVVFLFNPSQFNDAPAIHVQGIRDADIVVVTHHASGSSEALRASRIISAARGDLAEIPVFVDADPRAALSAPFWKAVGNARQQHKGGAFSALTNLLTPAPRTTTEFQRERGALVANYSELTLRPYLTTPEKVLQAAEALAAQGIVLSRVKGSLLNGTSVDLSRQGNSYTLASNTQSDGVGYLSLRSFTVQLSKYLAALTAHIGTPDCNPTLVQHVVGAYPNRQELERSISKGVVPLGFESDRLLSDLRTILPSMKHVVDPERRQELGMALVTCLQSAIQTRQTMVDLLRSAPRKDATTTLGLFNAYYTLTSLVCDPNLQMFFKHPLLIDLHRAVFQHNPAQALVQLAVAIPAIRFEGRRALLRDEVSSFAEVLKRAQRQSLLSDADLTATFTALARSTDPDLSAHRSALQ